MTVLLDHSVVIPFPQIDGNKGGRSVSEELWLCPFGFGAEDLAIDFEHTPRPWLETQILACCTTDKIGNRPADDFLWNLDVSKRTECLIAITSLAEPSRQIDVDLHCQNSECLEEMELELSIEDIASIQSLAEAHETIDVEIGDTHFSLRKPTGVDQLKWLTDSYTDEFAAAQAMVSTLLPEDQQISIDQENNHNNKWLQIIDDAMEMMDPLVNFHLKTSCPSCEKKYDYYIDLGEICLQKLHTAQDRLIEMVHTLAFHYHWNEQEIFALPFWRLQRHLRLIEREERK